MPDEQRTARRDPPPLIRVELGNGMFAYPKMERGPDGEWHPVDSAWWRPKKPERSDEDNDQPTQDNASTPATR